MLDVVALIAAAATVAAHAGGVPPKAAALKGLGPHTRLLVVAPHPDDATLGAGGLIQRVERHHGSVRVVFMTSGDGFPPGVALETHKPHPGPGDFRAYARRREREAVDGLAVLGVPRPDLVFLGFPDRGLCPILREHRVDRPPYYRSPFTAVDRPRRDEALYPGTEYDSADLDRELRRVVDGFRPTLVVAPEIADRHPDHCATYFFVRDVLDRRRAAGVASPAVVEYLVHFDGWPTVEGPVLRPPAELPVRGAWASLPLTPAEVATKRAAVARHRTQMSTMASYLLGFVRRNELFAVDGADASDDVERRQCCTGNGVG